MMPRLTVRITNGAIVIRLPLSVLPVAFEAAPFNVFPEDGSHPAYRVSDVNAFADAVVYELEREQEDGTTPVHLLFDAAMQNAVEDGCEGVDYLARGEKGGA